MAIGKPLDISRLWGLFARNVGERELFSAYREVFATPGARDYVLPDLAEYCGAAFPMPRDPAAMQRAAGRLDVWLRIRHAVDLSDSEVYRMLKGTGNLERRFE